MLNRKVWSIWKGNDDDDDDDDDDDNDVVKDEV